MYTRDSKEVLELLDKGYSVFSMEGKFPPPAGYTGYDGKLSTYENFGSCGTTHLGVRLYDTVGFDVDTDPASGHKIENPELEQLWREFIDTFNIAPVITGANTDNSAGIYHFAIGNDVTEADLASIKIKGLDIIRNGHRYAVIRGTHPNGNEYQGELPSKTELPVLTAPMVAWLAAHAPQAAPRGWKPVEADWQTLGQCTAVQSIVDSFEPDEQNRHGSFLAITYRLACMGASGHQGVKDAIERLRNRFAEYSDKDPREFENMLNVRHLPELSPVQCNGNSCRHALPAATARALFNAEHPHYAYRQNSNVVSEYLMWDGSWRIVTKVQLKGYLNRFVSQRQLNETLNSLEGTAANNPTPEAPSGILPCGNGLLNISTGEFMPHSKTVAGVPTSVNFDPSATAPRFTNEYLPRFAPEAETQSWLLSFAKYIITGGNEHEKFLILKGRGGTGKGTFLDILQAITGPELTTVHQGKSLTDTPKDGNSASPEVADMEGKRLIIVDELDEKIALLNAARVKQITGKSWISGRHLYGDMRKFKIQGVMIVSTNRTPRFRDDAEGIDRRVIFYKVPARTVEKDETLKKDILDKELPGILNMILAADDWDGTLPPAVQAMTNDYIVAMDMIESFVQDCLVPVESRSDGDKLANIYPVYEMWVLSERGGRPIGKQAFREAMEDKGYDFKDTGVDRNVAMYRIREGIDYE